MTTTVKSFKKRGSTIWLNKVEYVGFLIGNLPKKFGYILDREEDKDGISSWFTLKGMTYIQKSLL
jgi:hypothetical protein